MSLVRPVRTVARGLEPRVYPFRRPDAVGAPGRVDARHEAAHVNLVARGLDPRAYPLRRPDAVGAPERVDARHEAAHDDIVAAHDGELAAHADELAADDDALVVPNDRVYGRAHSLNPVARGLDPRAYPLRRPDADWAPERVDARHEAAHDGELAAHADELATHDEKPRGHV